MPRLSSFFHGQQGAITHWYASPNADLKPGDRVQGSAKYAAPTTGLRPADAAHQTSYDHPAETKVHVYGVAIDRDAEYTKERAGSNAGRAWASNSPGEFVVVKKTRVTAKGKKRA